MAIYNGRNNLPARQMITERARYSVRALTLLDRVNDLTLETNQIKDLNLDERIFIGRIDENNNPLFVKQRLLQSFGNPTPSKVGLNFVVRILYWWLKNLISTLLTVMVVFWTLGFNSLRTMLSLIMLSRGFTILSHLQMFLWSMLRTLLLLYQ